MSSERMSAHRAFLQDRLRMTIDFSRTDQSQGLPPPPVQKPIPEGAETCELEPVGQWPAVQPVTLEDAIRRRVSHRSFEPEPLLQQELSFLLWATQGIRRMSPGGSALRTVPSAGARHAFETYLVVLNVEGLPQGIYRYLSVEHRLVVELRAGDLTERIIPAVRGQRFAGRAAAVFVWTALPYRMEWRYDLAAHRVILMDVGHLCQNLYLACEAVGAGTCAIAAYDQDGMDELIGVDGEEEFTLYLAPVGKV